MVRSLQGVWDGANCNLPTIDSHKCKVSHTNARWFTQILHKCKVVHTRFKQVQGLNGSAACKVGGCLLSGLGYVGVCVCVCMCMCVCLLTQWLVGWVNGCLFDSLL